MMKVAFLFLAFPFAMLALVSCSKSSNDAPIKSAARQDSVIIAPQDTLFTYVGRHRITWDNDMYWPSQGDTVFTDTVRTLHSVKGCFFIMKIGIENWSMIPGTYGRTLPINVKYDPGAGNQYHFTPYEDCDIILRFSGDNLIAYTQAGNICHEPVEQADTFKGRLLPL